MFALAGSTPADGDPAPAAGAWKVMAGVTTIEEEFRVTRILKRENDLET
jgi:hypothetical protein